MPGMPPAPQGAQPPQGGPPGGAPQGGQPQQPNPEMLFNAAHQALGACTQLLMKAGPQMGPEAKQMQQIFSSFQSLVSDLSQPSSPGGQPPQQGASGPMPQNAAPGQSPQPSKMTG